MPAQLELFAACLPGLEPLLVEELAALGIDATALRGGASFGGDERTVMRACLWLGTASHVRIRVARFRCRALGELQRKAREIPWLEWLSPRVPLALEASARQSRVYHTGAIAERIADAVAEALGGPPPVASADDDTVAHVHARFAEDVCTISLDATPTPLHRRGYRLDQRKAPLREDLAHALVLTSRRGSDEALLDPFCGSGTIAIEAAGLARGLAPGRLRPPPLAQTARFDPYAWREIVGTVEPRAATAPIGAGDRDAGAIEATRANAARAGVADAIECHLGAVSTHPWLAPDPARPRGVVVSNPPFGRRVGKGQDLRPLYQTFGRRVAALGTGWRVALLAHDVRLARRTGVALHPAWTTRHGGLAVTAMVGPDAPATA